MTTPHSILLVPAEGSTLLDDGPCGARPPIARRGNCCAHAEHRRWEPWEPCWRNCYMCQHPQEALVLAWAGAPCLEGIVWLWAKVPDMPGPGALEGFRELDLAPDGTNPAAAATGGRFDHQRVAKAVRVPACILQGLHRTAAPRSDRNVGLLG